MSGRDGYGQRRVYVTPEMLETMIVNGQPINTNIPDNARFIRMYPEENGRSYVLVFESKKWDEIPEGEPIPEWEVEVERDTWTIVLDK